MVSLAKVLDGKPRSFSGEWLSVSKVKTFKDCPAKFRYNYIEKLPRKTWDFHVFGQFAHSSLEFFHDFIKDGDIRPSNEIMTESFKLAAKEHDNATTAQKKEIWSMMNAYLNKMAQEQSDDVWPEITEVEDNFYIDIDGKVLLNGFIDRVQVDSDGVLHVADYKTTKNKSYLKNDFLQLQTYAYVKCLQDPSLERVRVSYILLRHDFEAITKEYTRKQVMKIEDKFLKFAEDIGKEKLWRPSTSKLCRFCDFLENCDEGKAEIHKGVSVKYGALDWS
jgi:CRISPR/Cas system-associated exonuclease Cas4 (RecB family)